MEKSPVCKQHSQPVHLFCRSCNQLGCADCLLVHQKRGCATPISLFSYAEKELLPAYKARIDDFDKKEGTASEGSLSSPETVKAGLLKLRTQLEEFLQTINTALGSIENEQGVTKYKLKRNLVAQYEKLKKAVASEDVYYIANILNRPDALEATGNDKRLIAVLNKSIEEVMQMK
eukprot:TRINITY_DN2609_c0_g4_i1.p2 TRINITY_DN2609_c0_g4~~TRINITY_DN2609_c0_g4_i1.p2  ORF type:complete len:175 (+),score=27.91 TRINITY_DN2609_c0_g4_i1:87-611(+)